MVELLAKTARIKDAITKIHALDVSLNSILTKSFKKRKEDCEKRYGESSRKRGTEYNTCYNCAAFLSNSIQCSGCKAWLCKGCSELDDTSFCSADRIDFYCPGLNCDVSVYFFEYYVFSWVPSTFFAHENTDG